MPPYISGISDPGYSSIAPGALEKRLPPGWVIHVPLDGLVEAFFETVERLPIQFALRKCRVDRVAAVMTKPIRHE